MKPKSYAAVASATAIAVLSAFALTACSPAAAPTPTETPASELAVDPDLRALLPQQFQDSGVIRIGGDFATPPTLAADPSDPSKPTGIAPDLTTAIGQLLGVEFDWSPTAWSGQLPGLKAGTLDALMGQLSATADREKTVLDIVPYLRSQEAVLTSADVKLNSLSDLCGLKIGVPTGSIGKTTLQALDQKYCSSDPVEISEFADNTAGTTAVLSAQIDGFFFTLVMADGFVKENPKGFASFPIPKEESAGTNPGLSGIGISKDYPGLSKAISGALQKLADEGIYQKIFENQGWSELALSKDDMVVNQLSGTPAGQLAG